jgi:hypothetical protein
MNNLTWYDQILVLIAFIYVWEFINGRVPTVFDRYFKKK